VSDRTLISVSMDSSFVVRIIIKLVLIWCALMYALISAHDPDDPTHCEYLKRTRPGPNGTQPGNISIRFNATLPAVKVPVCLIQAGYNCLGFFGYRNRTDKSERENFMHHFSTEFNTVIRAVAGLENKDKLEAYYKDSKTDKVFVNNKTYKKLSKARKMHMLRVMASSWNCVSGTCTMKSKTVGYCAPGNNTKVWDYWIYQRALGRIAKDEDGDASTSLSASTLAITSLVSAGLLMWT